MRKCQPDMPMGCSWSISLRSEAGRSRCVQERVCDSKDQADVRWDESDMHVVCRGTVAAAARPAVARPGRTSLRSEAGRSRCVQECVCDSKDQADVRWDERDMRVVCRGTVTAAARPAVARPGRTSLRSEAGCSRCVQECVCDSKDQADVRWDERDMRVVCRGTVATATSEHRVQCTPRSAPCVQTSLRGGDPVAVRQPAVRAHMQLGVTAGCN
eukprot:SAG31_NODE_155_length_22130_cov_9.540098_6_plen_214_part_00